MRVGCLFDENVSSSFPFFPFAHVALMTRFFAYCEADCVRRLDRCIYDLHILTLEYLYTLRVMQLYR